MGQFEVTPVVYKHLLSNSKRTNGSPVFLGPTMIHHKKTYDKKTFCHRKKVIPFDVIFSHKERWMYPIKGDWSNCKPSQRETVRYYHASKKCLTSRFPYFSLEYIHIRSDVKKSLSDSRKTYLANEFGLTFD